MNREEILDVLKGNKMKLAFSVVLLSGFVIAETENPHIMTELIKQAPSAVATIVMALAFLKYQKNRDDAFLGYMRQRDTEYLEQQNKRDESLSTIGQDCHSFQQRLAGTVVAALEKNALALDRNTEAFGRMGAVCEQMETILSRMDGDLVRMDSMIVNKIKS